MSKYKDSYVLIFHGSRRGGKTLSMVVQVIIDMLSGRTVFANFLISFVYRGKQYSSLPLDYYALLAQDEGYKDSVICWDETALWAYARDSQSTFNKIIGLALTLIGKWECNLYCTVQFLNMIDKNFRQQADSIILCTDLSFKYKQLGRGTTIGQICQDISGRFTGDMYEFSHEVYQRTLHGKFAWGCYNTKQTFDIFDAKRKVKMDYGSVRIGESGVQESHQKGGLFSDEDAQILVAVQHILGEFAAEGKDKIKNWEFKNRLSNNGLYLRPDKLRRVVAQLDIEVQGDPFHQVYILPKDREEEGVLV